MTGRVMGTDRIEPGIEIGGKYRIERLLGEGGMGAVYLARQLPVDRSVALKFLRSAVCQHRVIQTRFELEARALARLNHPNCITLYDYGWAPELEAFYTALEYVRGVPLHERLGGQLDWREVVEIVRQVALALDHAHHHGILHRDLKPENVMLTVMTDGSLLAKVLDFGIARIFRGDPNDHSSGPSPRLTGSGEVFGTPAYISPEQARGVEELGPGCDLYSLGVMFYELLEGQLPYVANNAVDLMTMHVRAPLPELTPGRSPAEVSSIVGRLLAKKPQDRPTSAGALAQELKRLLQRDNEAISVIDAAPFPGGAPRLSGGSVHEASPIMAPRDEPTSAPTERSPAPWQMVAPAVMKDQSRELFTDCQPRPKVDRTPWVLPVALSVVLLSAAAVAALALLSEPTLTPASAPTPAAVLTAAAPLPVPAPLTRPPPTAELQLLAGDLAQGVATSAKELTGAAMPVPSPKRHRPQREAAEPAPLEAGTKPSTAKGPTPAQRTQRPSPIKLSLDPPPVEEVRPEKWGSR